MGFVSGSPSRAVTSSALVQIRVCISLQAAELDRSKVLAWKYSSSVLLWLVVD